MKDLSRQLSFNDTMSANRSACFFRGKMQFDILLLIETIVVTTVIIAAVRFCYARWDLTHNWLFIPLILISAALIPSIIKTSKLSDISAMFKQPKYSLIILGWTCLAVLPVSFCLLWLLRMFDMSFPLSPQLHRSQSLINWLIYQLLYVAVAEEVFFRGYVQGNIERLITPLFGKQIKVQQWSVIIISAACFAAAHIIVCGQIISALVFLPGLILGWLFFKTKSLIAPILFHAIANIFYLFTAISLG